MISRGALQMRFANLVDKYRLRAVLWIDLPQWFVPVVLALILVGAVWIFRGATAAITVALIVAALPIAIAVGRWGVTSIALWAVLSGPATPFLNYPYQHSVLTFDRVWLLGIGASILLVSTRTRWAVTSRRIAVAMAVFCAVYGLLSCVSSVAVREFGPLHIWFDAILLPGLLFLATARLVTTVGQTRRVVAAIAVGGLLIGGLGIAESRLGFELATRDGSSPRVDTITGVVRVSGPYPVPEVLALTLLVCLAMTMYWMLTQRGKWQWVAGAAALVQVVGIGLTFFRAAWIGAAIIVVGAFAIRPGQVRRLLTITGAAAAVAIVAFLALEHIPVLARRLTSDFAVANVYLRVATDIQSLQLFARAPLFGIGAEDYAAVATHHAAPIWAGVPAVPFPHNSYLGLLAEQGLVGFLPFVAVTVLAVLAIREVGRQGASRDDILLGACAASAGIAYLVMSLTLTMLPYGSSNAFLALLLGLVCGRLNARATGQVQEVPVQGGALGRA